jgi:hypothetical protein
MLSMNEIWIVKDFIYHISLKIGKKIYHRCMRIKVTKGNHIGGHHYSKIEDKFLS